MTFRLTRLTVSMAQTTPPKTLAQRVAEVFPRSHLVTQPVVGERGTKYFNIELSVWVGKQQFFLIRYSTYEEFGMASEYIIESMLREITGAAFASTK